MAKALLPTLNHRSASSSSCFNARCVARLVQPKAPISCYDRNGLWFACPLQLCRVSPVSPGQSVSQRHYGGLRALSAAERRAIIRHHITAAIGNHHPAHERHVCPYRHTAHRRAEITEQHPTPCAVCGQAPLLGDVRGLRRQAAPVRLVVIWPIQRPLTTIRRTKIAFSIVVSVTSAMPVAACRKFCLFVQINVALPAAPVRVE